ncbi:MAG: hypothetical protein PVF05_10620 [Gemmatimonadales bacterium]|jgi:hypothetical protein
MKPTRSREKIHPGIALALLTSLRDQDTPTEAIEDEAFSESLPRRLGLNDVINVQMRRYADLKDAGQSLAFSEFLDLVRLISRRPDATEVFRAAGAALAADRFAETGPLGRAFRRLYPEGVRRRKLVRSMTRAAKALTPGAEIEADREPPTMVIDDCALAPAGVAGNSCEILTAVLDVCVTEIWDPELSVRHSECIGRGDDRCTWTLVETSDAGDPARDQEATADDGTRAAG